MHGEPARIVPPRDNSATLAYFIYGSRPAYQAEAAFSIRSARSFLAREPSSIEVAIVTDQPQLHYDMAARIIPVTADELRGWTSDGRYNHRAKVCALRRVLAEGSERVALIDTDTYFVGHPAQLFARIDAAHAVMHADEGPVGEDSAWRAIFADPALTAALSEHGCRPATPMFNSGVIGVHARHARLVDAALAFLDAEQARIRAFSLEQVAFSVALAQSTRVLASDDVVEHYWGHRRPFVHVQIARALAGAHVPVASLGFPPVALRDKLQSHGVAAALRWPADARFAYRAALAAQRSHASHDGYAAAWAETAIVALERGREVTGLVPARVPGLKRALAGLAHHERLSPPLAQRFRALW